MTEPMYIALAALLLFALIVLLVAHLRLRSRVHDEAEQRFLWWREHELERERADLDSLAVERAELQLEEWKQEHTGSIRKDAIGRSKAVTTGQVMEQLTPYLPGFMYDPRDARFLGSPIDFVVFDGLSQGKVRRVILVEVKTGKSTLSTRERRVRDAVLDGRVEWEEIRIEVG